MLVSAHVSDADAVIDDLRDLNERFSGKCVVLTGAAGFLGVNFVYYFLRLNERNILAAPCRLVAIDSFLRGAPKWLESLSGRADLKLLKADVVALKEFHNADFIVHAASVASPTFYRQFPIETMDANVIGLRNVLDYATRQPVSAILNFSTSEIYGDPDAAHIPTSEDYRGYVSCTGPRACYDESKRYGETLCVNFARQRGVAVKIARPFNNYGPGLRLTDRRVLPDFFRDALNGRDIVLLSDGRATRTFCYISDAIAGYIRILLRGRPGEPYNIGNDKPEVSMSELARMVIEVTGEKVSLRHKASEDKDYLTDNPQRRCPDIRKAQEELGFRAHVDLISGLRRTLDYYRANPE